MQDRYTQRELDDVVSRIQPRHGWDFSRMADWRAPVPWDYLHEVRKHLDQAARVLDIGTGGGERFLELAPFFGEGLGVDIDAGMIAVAVAGAKDQPHVTFRVSDEQLAPVTETFDLIIDRHAPFAAKAVHDHLRSGGLFITQQVGERNMRNVRRALGQPEGSSPIRPAELTRQGLEIERLDHYDVAYGVADVESLVFWLSALDLLHADLEGGDALADVEVFNRILAGSVDERGFVTNEHRYLVIARKP